MMRCVLYLVITILLLLLLQYHHVAAAVASTTRNATNNTTEMSLDMQQKLALFQFKLSFSIDNSSQPSWHPKTMNWSMDSDYCKWDGVTCNHTTGDVIGLDLSCGRLVGSINPNSTLFQLSHLQVIDFEHNYISGIIPEEIFHLPNLKELSISPGIPVDSNNLKQVSASLNFPKVRWGSNNTLQKLDLDGTFVGGVIPEEIFHLPKLEDLTLIGNSILVGNPDVSVSLPKLKWGSSNTLQSLTLMKINIIGGVLHDSIGYLNSLTSLDLWDCNLFGPIPRYIGNLTQLTHLGLGGNPQLSGPIPDSLANLKKLEELILPSNNLNGEFPSWVANLTQLIELDLSTNSLIGSLPSYLPPHSLIQLHSLYLSDNSLNGTIPSWLFQLPSLTKFFIDFNKFTGQLPYQFNSSISSLLYFSCGHNSLSGTIPSWLFQLPSLTELDIDSNKFTGHLPYQFNSSPSSLLYFSCRSNSLSSTIPSWLFQLPSLTELYIDSNKFTGQLPYKFNSSTSSSLRSFYCSNNLLKGTIPKSFFDQLVNLTYLDLSSNKFSGDLDLQTFSHLQDLQILQLSHNRFTSLRITSTTTLPPTLDILGLVSCKIIKFPHFIRSLKNLTYLDLSNNQIDGNIPDWIGGLTGMNYLNLSHNSITGGLEQLTWSSLQYLDLQSNMFNGSLTTSICNSTSLKILNLSHNNFSGAFPVCPGNLSYSLSVLDLRMNNITGSLPLALSKFQNLRSLNMHGNKLQGTIPPSFSEFDSLQVLDLGNNHIDGTFPHFLEALPKLQVLILKSNKFHGNINNISHIEHPFPSLRIIDLSDNHFSGPLPAKYIDNFKGMMNKEVNKVPLGYMGEGYMGDRSYSDSIALVIKGRDMELVKILTVFTTIDLSRNMFEGEIPAHIGSLVSLRYLNLSRNHLTGSIPSSIGDLSVLESLDFSSNRLVGKIPQQLTHIDSLAKLNLSQNDLNGHIPEAPHFCTFDNNSYSGNPGLCGFPLSKKCRGDNLEPQEEDDEGDDYFFSGFAWEAVVIGYGCGVVMGFVGGYIMFMAGKPKWYIGIIARELGLKVKRIEIARRYQLDQHFNAAKKE